MNCRIYRSPKKDEMYLYLVKEDDFDAVPEELLKRFGAPAQIMALELTPERKLAREDVQKVKANLADKGYHLQMPPTLVPDLYHGNED